MRRAKIVCTLGPATATPAKVRELVEAGMNVARLNMSHGSHDDHLKSIQMVREASEELQRGVGIFADLQGPKIRLATFPDGPVTLVPGATFTITTREVEGSVDICGTTYSGLAGDVKPGDPLLIDDGKVRLEAVEVTATDVITRVVVGGPVSNHKGINLPGVAVSVPALSEKDTEDLRWALAQGVDFIALSFVRNASDAADVRAIMTEEGRTVPVVAKIEKPQAIDNITEIIHAFDGLMVARGDLGVECPLEEVPLLQKDLVDIARRNAKPVIVATQMLESMIVNPAPTRAETSDVANAVLDGADAVMLSGETSVGAHAIEAVRTMARIVQNTEEHGLARMAEVTWQPSTTGGIIAKAAAEVGERVGAKYLVAFTQSGDSAKRLARYRSHIPLLACTPLTSTRARLALSWGVEAMLLPQVEHTDEMVYQVDTALLERGMAKEGDLIVIIAGTPPGLPGSTNALRIHRMGDAIKGLSPAYRGAKFRKSIADSQVLGEFSTDVDGDGQPDA